MISGKNEADPILPWTFYCERYDFLRGFHTKSQLGTLKLDYICCRHI